MKFPVIVFSSPTAPLNADVLNKVMAFPSVCPLYAASLLEIQKMYVHIENRQISTIQKRSELTGEHPIRLEAWAVATQI